jgi:hypothetical protein
MEAKAEDKEDQPAVAEASISGEPADGKAPSVNAVSLRDGYTQTYMILKQDPAHAELGLLPTERNVLFRCGNWCYRYVTHFRLRQQQSGYPAPRLGDMLTPHADTTL